MHTLFILVLYEENILQRKRARSLESSSQGYPFLRQPFFSAHVDMHGGILSTKPPQGFRGYPVPRTKYFGVGYD